MENSKPLISAKVRMLLLVSILILAGSVIFITLYSEQTRSRAYLQTLKSLAFNK